MLFSLCKSMWIIDPFVTRFSPHPKAPTCPLPLKCCEVKATTQHMCWQKFKNHTIILKIIKFLKQKRLNEKKTNMLVQSTCKQCMSKFAFTNHQEDMKKFSMLQKKNVLWTLTPIQTSQQLKHNTYKKILKKYNRKEPCWRWHCQPT